MVLGALQRQFIYYPDTERVPPAGSVITGGQDLRLRTDDGLELGAWLIREQHWGNGHAVLYLPGGRGNRGARTLTARALANRGLTVLMLDYRGFGGNPGAPTEAGLALDADAAVRALRACGFAPNDVIYVGEALGASVATSLAARFRPAGMVLRSPWPELAAVASQRFWWLPVRPILEDRFPVIPFLSQLDAPVSVIYGDHDTVVPPVLSRAVADDTLYLFEELVLRGTGHHDPEMFGSRLADAVVRLSDWISR